ncbi:MAG: hypothetical protein HY097_11160 [Nitrospinae bacterium]|nr:hypothetical protein [Nitrospinota bacterium]
MSKFYFSPFLSFPSFVMRGLRGGRIRNNLLLTSPVLLILLVFFFLTGFAGEDLEKLSIPLKAIPAKDREGLQKILNGKTAFLKWRDEEIETTVKVFGYLFDRPALTSTILTELGIAQYQIESEAKNSYIFDDGAGLTGELKMLYRKDRERIYRGTYVYTTGAGIPVRLSGDWALVLKYKKEEEMLKIDIDLYLKSDEEKLSKITKDMPFIIKAIMFEKVNSYIESLRELCESIQNDPDDVYEILQEGGEIKEKDLKEFKKAVVR